MAADKLCYSIAKKAHEGQTRKVSGKPYIIHPLSVANSFKSDSELRCIAVLHDVLEDSSFTAKDLIKMGVPIQIVEVVKVLTHSDNETYDDYIARVAKNPKARQVKIADILDNMKDCEPSKKAKYAKALSVLGYKHANF